MVLQGERSECGVACLASVLAWFGRWAPLAELREACGVGRDGSTALDVVRAARTYGLHAEGRRRPAARIHLASLPAILFWEFNHFVVLEGFGKRRFHLNDPASGRRVVDRQTFERGFAGVVLEFAAGPEFRRSRRPPGALRRLWSWLRAFKPALLLIVLLGLLLALARLAVPLLLAVLVDHVMEHEQVTWLGVAVAVLVGLGAAIYLLASLRLRVLRRLAVSISIARSERFITHLFRLPMQFFSSRLTGDLLIRMQEIDNIARTGAVGTVNVGVEAVTSLAFLAVMVAYHPPLAAAVFLLSVSCGLLMLLTANLRTDHQHRLRRESGLLVGRAMAGLRAMRSIRATARENSFFSGWSGYQANELSARQSFKELGHVAAVLPELFLMFGSALVLGVGGWQVAAGNVTVGMLLGFYLLAANFMGPVGRFMLFANELQTIHADMARLEDVFDVRPARQAEAGDDRPRGRVATLDGGLRLTGRVELRNVTFGHQRNKPPLIEEFNLLIEPGERVAVVGTTGAGKTSLALLVAGVYRPWSGDVLFDGHRLDDIPREVFAASVGMVDQHPVLFEATVRENLTFWNPTVPDKHVVAAARDAAVHDTIASRPGGYDSRVEENGRNFSGGQRQRLEIARSLTRNPSLLILDEATSSLDPMTEVRIDHALRRRGCSCLIVAHRLSTIRDSDRIVVLERGREVQRGRHEELMAAPGLYQRLVR